MWELLPRGTVTVGVIFGTCLLAMAAVGGAVFGSCNVTQTTTRTTLELAVGACLANGGVFEIGVTPSETVVVCVNGATFRLQTLPNEKRSTDVHVSFPTNTKGS